MSKELKRAGRVYLTEMRASEVIKDLVTTAASLIVIARELNNKLSDEHKVKGKFYRQEMGEE